MEKKRLIDFLNGQNLKIKTSYKLFIKQISFNLFLLLSSFFFGNLFNLFFNKLRHLLIWEPLILFFLLLILELINLTLYTNKTLLFQNFTPLVSKSFCRNTPLAAKKMLNSLKIGLLLGLCIDAFKVGS
jgi:hypothetical protein